MDSRDETERTVSIRVWGRDFPITFWSNSETGKTHWSTPTDGHWSQISGIARSPLAAVEDARDWLQCRRQPADHGDIESPDVTDDDEIALKLVEAGAYAK